jgi:hypothetical protein
MSVFTLLGSLIALLSGIFAVSLVLATASAGSLACQLRQSLPRRDHAPAY